DELRGCSVDPMLEIKLRRNHVSSAQLYDKAIENLKLAYKNHPISGEIKEILEQARKEYEEIKELSWSEEERSPNKESDAFIKNIFFKKNHVPEKNIPLGEDDELINAQQLAYELCREDISYEQKEELCTLAQNIINRFAEIKPTNSKLVHEVMILSHLPDSEKELYRNLIETFINKINEAILLHPPLLKGLSHIIHQANPKHLKPNDLVCILTILNEKIKNLHSQDMDLQIEMTRTLGQLFDAMADCEVQDLDYEKSYKPLYDILRELNSDNNQELVYHAKYACQALICVPNNESPWKAFLRRSNKTLQVITNLTGAVKNINPGKLAEAIKDLSKRLESIINNAVDLVKEIQSVKEGVSDIIQNFSLEVHRKWYWALRFTDLFIQSHKFASLEKFVYKISCNQDDEFLWDSELDTDIRKELLTSSKYIQNSALSFPTALLKDQNDLKKSRRELSAQLNGLKEQFFSDVDGLKEQFFSDVDDEFEEALELEGDVEEVVYGFLKSKDKLTSDDKEALEVAVNELSNSGDISSIINTVNSFFVLENKLTLYDEKVLEKATKQFLDLKVNKALELQEKITNEFWHSSKSKESLIKVINNVLKENPIIIEDEDIKSLEIEANKYLNLNDKSIFESAVNKFLASKAKKNLEITVNKIVTSKCKKVLLILGVGGTGKSTFGHHLARCLWEEYDKLNTLQSPIPLFIPLARLKEGMFNSDADFIELYLKEKCKLPPEKINALRERKFIFILDGYDEIVERERHCYIENKFCEWKNAKIIISCRPEYLGSGYQKRFFPKNGEKGFQELTIKAFSEKE
ncbi:32353_t:CDS:2, partial [Racocetra persica]